jgi:NitT/TauT family transport system permease protein
MIRKEIDYKWQVVIGCVSLIVIGFLYQCLSWQRRSVNPTDTTMPGIVEIFTNGTYKICTPDAFDHVWILEDSMATGYRFFLGMGVGVVFSFVIGVSMGCFPLVESVFRWPVTFLGQIPPTAMLAVYLVVYALTKLPVVEMMICFGILPSLTLTIYNCVKKDVHDESIYKAYTLGASSCEVIWNVVIQQITPRVIDAIRICIGPALVYLIAGEWANEHIGFGYRLKIQGRLTHMDVVYNYLAILAIFGYLMSLCMIQVRRFVSPWYGK